MSLLTDSLPLKNKQEETRKVYEEILIEFNKAQKEYDLASKEHDHAKLKKYRGSEVDFQDVKQEIRA